MMPPEISCVILNYNTQALLQNCVNSILEYSPHSEIIVIDNASSDDSVALITKMFPSVKLIANTANLGFARGMNLGLHAAQAAQLFCLNADTELLADTLPPLQATLAQWPRVGIVGPAHYLPPADSHAETGPHLASAFHDPTLNAEALRLLCFTDAWAARLKIGPWRAPAGPSRSTNWLMGAAVLIRRECLKAIGGFDEGGFMYGEDWDLCYRARQADWAVYYAPAARILHHENAAGKIAFGSQRAARVLLANLYFHEKHYGRLSRRMLAALTWTGAYLRLTLLTLGRRQPEPEFSSRWQMLCELAQTAQRGMR